LTDAVFARPIILLVSLLIVLIYEQKDMRISDYFMFEILMNNLRLIMIQRYGERARVVCEEFMSSDYFIYVRMLLDFKLLLWSFIFSCIYRCWETWWSRFKNTSVEHIFHDVIGPLNFSFHLSIKCKMFKLFFITSKMFPATSSARKEKSGKLSSVSYLERVDVTCICHFNCP